MIYLIGGPPRCGKTTLAALLSQKTGLPYFPLDHLTSLISPYIEKRKRGQQLPLLIARERTGYNNDAFYSHYSTEEIISFYLRQAETYWPGIKSFITYAVDDGHDLILEGWQILPHLLQSVDSAHDRDRLRTVFLYKTDAGAIERDLKASSAPNDWAKNNTRNERTFSKIAAMVSRFSRYVADEAVTSGFPAVNIEHEFNEPLERIANDIV
jgi:2-phosphoglycerate kinase